MTSPALYSLAADTLLITHVIFVIFVVLGLIVILVGRFRFWQWFRNPWFRRPWGL